jgi:hypothetical protein
MFPLIAIVLGCVTYTILGLIVLACIPLFRLTLLNLILFVVGASLAGPVFLFTYGQIFARDGLSNAAFVGIFPVLLIGGGFGGTLMIWLFSKVAKRTGG